MHEAVALARKPTAKQIAAAEDVLIRAQRPAKTKQFTPIIPNQIGLVLELLARKYGKSDRTPERELITDLLFEAPLGGPVVSDEVVEILDLLLAAEAGDRPGADMLGIGISEIAKRAPPPPKKRKDSPALKAQKKNLSKAFKDANKSLRKKNGQLKKGKTQSDVAKTAHRLVRKMNGTKKGEVRKTARRAFEKSAPSRRRR